MTEDPPGAPAVTLSIPAAGNGASETVDLLDGGGQAYPRMLDAIAAARHAIHLEVYAFAPSGVGQRFVQALGSAARRGVNVRVLIDGWGSARGGRHVAAALDAHGCSVKVHNRLLAALIGRIGRNHRKILLVDDEVAYLDKGVVRAIVAAARRGVEVRLLLAGRSDVPFARAASRSLYRQLLLAGVRIHEWNDSVLHAKVATVDGRRLLVGSFNLDPFSLANLETLVDVEDPRVVAQAETWISDHFGACSEMTSIERDSPIQRWMLDPFGRLVAKLADATSRVLASRHQRGAATGRSIASRSRIDRRPEQR